MKNSISLIILLLLMSFSQQRTFAQGNVVDTVIIIQHKIWPDRTTNTLVKGRKVWPLLGVKKRGAGNNMEWQIQPLFFFVSPNLGLKKQWLNHQKGWSFASLHKINYPSIYLNLIAREGAGGVLPKESQIPAMISLRNEFLLGFNTQANFFTLRLGIATTFQLGSAEKNFPDIDIPFLYNRTLSLNNTPNIYFGINFNRDLHPRLNLEADFSAYKVDFDSNDFVYESQLLFLWRKSSKFGIKFGAAAAHGRYPYGSEFMVIPVVDFLFGFGRM